MERRLQPPPDFPRILEEQARDCPFLDDRAATEVRVEAQAFRTQVVVLLDAASDPATILEVRVENGIKGLSLLLVNPVPYSETPKLFCLVLNREFDLECLIPLAEPVQVDQRF